MNAIVKTTPADGRFLADELYIKGYVDDARKIRSLADQVETLTKERDEQCHAADHWISEATRDHNALQKLTQDRDELKAARYAYASEFSPNEEGHPDVGSIHQNIRALKSAAKLALDALYTSSHYTSALPEYHLSDFEVNEAIAALRQAGVQ